METPLMLVTVCLTGLVFGLGVGIGSSLGLSLVTHWRRLLAWLSARRKA